MILDGERSEPHQIEFARSVYVFYYGRGAEIKESVVQISVRLYVAANAFFPRFG